MKKKMSDKDKKLLYFLGAIALVALCYFLVFNKFNTKRQELSEQNDTMQQEVAQLETMVAGKDAIIDDTNAKKVSITDNLKLFPAEVRTQNAIYDLNQMYESIHDVKIQSENYTMNQVFYQPGMTVGADGTVTMPTTTADPNAPTQVATVAAITGDTASGEIVADAANFIGYRSDVVVTFTAPYKSVKEVIDYINGSDNRMSITDLSVTTQDDTDDLSCSMSVSMYAIANSGEGYEQPSIPASNGEKSDIFKDN